MNAHKAKLLTYTRKTTGLIGLICTLAFSHLAGQVKEMPLDYLQRVYYSGSYVDYQIPEDITVDWLYLKIGGGDGGYYGMNDHNMTGKGATVEGYLPISSTKSSSSVLPGSVLRFIVGQEGHYGGGGGGTAVAIKNKGETIWTLLMVGGGGGGSSFWNKGDPGRTATSGSPGLGDTGGTLQNGGSNGEGGGMSGGGGYKGDGGQFKESDNPEAWAIRTVGKKGNNAANEPVGGQGGVGSDGSYGGFGYGSGGAGYWYNKDKRGEYMSGGGGGGYSGGGGGSNNFGGGGGSYANENLIQWPHIELQGYSSDLNDGYALFKLSSLNLMRPAKNTQLCLTDFSQGTAKGNNIDLSVCQDGGGQKWVFEENAVRYTETDNKCMDLKQSNMTDGANIQLWDCNNTGAQKWLYDGINRNIRLKMNIDWCLALEDGSAEDGHNVQLGKCNYSDSQQWEVSGLSQAEVSNYNRIRYLKDSGKCVDVQSSSTADGANVQIYHCGDTPSQYWYFEGNSIRFNKDHGKCLDLDYSKTDNRTNIQLWQCNGTRAQQWIYDGRTRTFRSAINPDKCLDVDNNGTADHTNIQLYDCNNTDAQQFIIEALPCVVDIVPPVAKCRDRTFTGLTAPVVADIDDGSYDNCTVSSRLLKNLSGNTYQLTIKDAAGNSSTCTARISY